MNSKQKIVNAATLHNRFDRRTVMFGAMQASIGTLLAVRLGYLAIAQNEKYQLQAESNRVNLSLIPPRRGLILDRNNIPLAANRADFRVDIIPGRLQNRESTLATLQELLDLDPVKMQDISDKLGKSRGFAPVQVASGLSWEKFASVSVRLPDLPGVVTQRGFSRFYQTGPSVGHLIGYVGPAYAEDYEKERNPLMLTPGFKIGKDGLEKYFDKHLRGVPGARRVEVNASGRVVRVLDNREDVPGFPIQLTIDGPLQDYAARRIGTEAGAAVVIDCTNGDILAMVSMPSFDPNSFADGIGRLEWKMLQDDDHVPLRDKVLRGLYPPGSTIKPAVALSFLEADLDPAATVVCTGGLRVGNRVFHCWNRRGHGTVNMAKAIYQSCDIYFYHYAQKVGMNKIAEMAHRLGLGAEYPLPVSGQSYGTIPDPEWKMRKYKREWANFDTVNATIGQGYMLVNPLQQAVMTARIASGRKLMPQLIHNSANKDAPWLGISQEHLDFVHQAMSDVVNGPGTARRAAIPVPGVLLAGKTGTAQVVSLNVSSGKSGPRKYRDHGHFICFAPHDKPQYACAVLIEHGSGSSAAYPVARDIMTFLFDPDKALDVLHKMESQWGGTAQERLNAKYAAYTRKYGTSAPQIPKESTQEKPRPTATQPLQKEAQSPAPEPVNTERENAPAPQETPEPAITAEQ